MPAHESDPHTSLAAAVSDIIERARHTVGSGPLLASRLAELGVGPEGGTYSPSAISNWINGRTMPPAHVLLAAANIAGVSIDAHLTSPTATEGQEPSSGWTRAAEGLQAQLDALQSELINLYGQLGLTRPQTTKQPQTTRRSGSG